MTAIFTPASAQFVINNDRRLHHPGNPKFEVNHKPEVNK